MITINFYGSKKIDKALEENAKVSSEAVDKIKQSNGTLPKHLLPKKPQK